jgi:hypothetical protein
VTTFLLCLACAVLVWALMRGWAKRAIAAERDRAELAIQCAKQQEAAATGQIARLVRETKLRDEAWRKGRDDMIAIIPLIDAARPHDRGDRAAADSEEGAA